MSEETIKTLADSVCKLRKLLAIAIVIWVICVFGLLAHVIHDAIAFEELRAIVFTTHSIPQP